MAENSFGVSIPEHLHLPQAQVETCRISTAIGEDIIDHDHEIMVELLRDHTTGKNITWATDSYAEYGDGYRYGDEISVEAVTGNNRAIVVPRVFKTLEQRRQRSKEMAEVFTPAWICNKQNNLIDNAWFGNEGTFNTEIDSDGDHSWKASAAHVTFPEGRTWKDYVNEDRMEITCGEAPYLVSRYDTVTGNEISVAERIGLLDRKLRIVSENTALSSEWLRAAQAAYQSIYGYDWQGDNVLLARKNLLQTFIDNYHDKFGRHPQRKSLLYIAYIISWNIWQMDGLKGVIPGSCGERRTVVADLFGETETVSQCEGCRTGNIRNHNGTYCLIKDWNAKKDKQKIRFIDLIK